MQPTLRCHSSLKLHRPNKQQANNLRAVIRFSLQLSFTLNSVVLWSCILTWIISIFYTVWGTLKQDWPFFKFHGSALELKKLHLALPLLPSFRPLRCCSWVFAGWLSTSWSSFSCSSPHERWSSSTGRPDSRWCWTGTRSPVRTGWCCSWCCSPESLFRAPEVRTHEDQQQQRILHVLIWLLVF